MGGADLFNIFFDLFCTVNQRNITSDFNDLHATIQDIRLACQKMPATAEDRFAVVMSVSSIKISKLAMGLGIHVLTGSSYLQVGKL